MALKTVFFFFTLNLIFSVSEAQELDLNPSFNAQDKLYLLAFKPFDQYQFDEQFYFTDEDIENNGDIEDDIASGISSIRKAVGVGTGAIIGFGVGHLIHGNWLDSNAPIFTFGELGAAVATWGFAEKQKHGAATASFIVFGGLRIWEIVDLAQSVDWSDDTLSTVAITGAAGFVLWKAKDWIGDLFTGDGGLFSQTHFDNSKFILAPIQFEGEERLAVGLEIKIQH